MARLALDIRGALLKSGREEFLAHGFEKASLRAICKKAGLTTGAFYSHFSGKEELFDALVKPMIDGFSRMYPSFPFRKNCMGSGHPRLDEVLLQNRRSDEGSDQTTH